MPFGRAECRDPRAAGMETGMSTNDDSADVAADGDPASGPDTEVRSLAQRLISTLDRPELIGPADVTRCTEQLGTAGLPSEAYDRALSMLAAAIYWRPDLVGAETVAALASLFANADAAGAIRRRAGDVLGFLLVTPAAPHAFPLVTGMLARSGRSRTDYEILLDALGFASAWAPPRLNPVALVTLAESHHLGDHRECLLHGPIERALFARPEFITVDLLERLVRLFAGHPSLKYLLFYLASHTDVSLPTRGRARTLIAEQFPLHKSIRRELGEGPARVLVVQNISDRQGDEIIRVVPLLDALLQFNPLLDVVLVTKRGYLYAHPRITPVAIADGVRTRSLLRQRFDAVIDFYEPQVPSLNYDRELEYHIKAHERTFRPFLSITAVKGWNEFLYQKVDVESRPCAGVLGLDRQRVDNIYEPTFRLIAELGLPLRLGEAAPDPSPVLAGLPCPDAAAAWSRLVARNTGRRPIALLCPFGGAEPLKGYVEHQLDALAERLRALIGEGYYVVLLPNGMPWGSARHADSVVSCLEPAEQAHVIVAPGPAEARGVVTYEHAGTHTVPSASYQMRLLTYFVRFADLVVTVEGWMVHAAYCLGKRYRVLMLPYSHPTNWHPYGRTLRQEIAEPATTPPHDPSAEEAKAPPLPDQPRKFVFLYLLGALGRSDDAQAVPLLCRALRSEDRDVRLAATQALARFAGADVALSLRDLLSDPAHRVRGAAATTLLERMDELPESLGGLRREHLLAHQAIGRERRDWAAVARLGQDARPALNIAIGDDDEAVRREAAQIAHLLNRSRARARTPARTTKSAARLLSIARRKDGSVADSRLGRRLDAVPDSPPAAARPTILILTPVKDAADCLAGYAERLQRLTYPHDLISLGFLESDSRDTTFADLQRLLPALGAGFRRARLWKQDFGYRIPPGVPRWDPAIQVERRAILAKGRNHLLFRALDDEAWVLWLDVDVVAYPADLIEQLLATGRDVVQPHCVLEPGGPTFDQNGWRDQGRFHLDALRTEGELVELDAVGGTVLLVRADVHREGLVFPTFLYGAANPRVRAGRRDLPGRLTGEIETEGLGVMARDMGYRCWGMPHFEVIHRRK